MELHPSVVLFAFSAAFTPGPNNIMMMTSGLNFGVRASIPHLLGICFGVPTMFLAVGFGLGYLFEQLPLLHMLIKVLGIAYLLYLAWLIANSAPAKLEGGRPRPLSFIQAALFQWINPKAWIMGTSAIAAYTTVGADINIQILWIALLFFLMAFPSAGIWLLGGLSLKRLLKEPGYHKAFNVVMALLLVLSVWPIVEQMIADLLSAI